MSLLYSSHRKSFLFFLFLVLAFTFSTGSSNAASSLPDEVIVAQAQDGTTFFLQTVDLQKMRQEQSPQVTLHMRIVPPKGPYMKQKVEFNLAENKYRVLIYVLYNRDGSYRYGENKPKKWKTIVPEQLMSTVANSCKMAVLYGKVWDIRHQAYIPLE